MPRQQFGFQLPVKALRTLAYVFVMFLCYHGLAFYNRCLLQIFHSPLSVSVVHHAVVVLSATFLRLLWVTQITDKRKNFPNWSLYLKHELPTVIAWALDIGCSIWNLVYMTLLSLNTMTTSTSMIFILMFAIVFGLEQWNNISQIFVGIPALITCWLLLFTFESTESNADGFVSALFVSGLSCLHWIIAQILAQKQESDQQALEKMQQVIHENNSLLNEKWQWKKEESDRLFLIKRLQQGNIDLMVENNTLQTLLREEQAKVHELKMALVTAEPATEKCQPKEFGDQVVSLSENNVKQL